METRETVVLFAEASADAREGMDGILRETRGTRLKTIGGAHLCLFPDVNSACFAASKLRDLLKTSQFRAGIARGPVTVSGDDAFGETVNLAAKLQGVAAPQQVLLSPSALDALDRLRFPVADAGSRQFKGVAQAIPLHSLQWAGERVPAKELFDFSRVSQERMQEKEALRNIVEQQAPAGTAPILLAHETPGNRGVPLRPKPTPPRPAAVEAFSQRRRELKKKALGLFLTFAVAVPLLVLGGIWGFSKLLESSTTPAVTPPDPRDSEIIRSVERGKTRKKIVVPKYAVMTVRTEPEGARVFLNDRLVSDTTPVTINNVHAFVPLQVRATKIGYEDAVTLLNLQGNETRVIDLKLARRR